MNNDNFVATHPGTIVQYILNCETTTKIYSVCKLNTLNYVDCVIFCFELCVSLIFLTLCFILFVSRTFRRISKQIFFQDSVRKQKNSSAENRIPRYHCIYLSNSQENIGNAMRNATVKRLPRPALEMPRYCFPVEFFYFGF